MRKIIVIALLGSVVGLGACARGVPMTAPLTAVEEPQPAATEPQDGESLPAVTLSSEVLYDILLGEIAVRRNELAVAAEAYARAAENTRDYRLAERAMQIAMRAKNFDRAFQVAILWSELQPDAIPPMEAVAVSQVASNRVSEAEETFTRLISRAAPEVGKMYRRIADLLSRQTNVDGALALMDDLVALHADNAEAYYAKAFLADRLKRPTLVVKAIDKALELRPEWEEAALAKAAHLLAQKKT
ncbi:MAG: tetratricopeptide repeat protein, partial [Gammaproteobacteria bacterium]|nr:tetratricopeptide repeat protein [Gammaproteobacteria bacterium]